MTVRELIILLQDEDPDALVVMAKDSEGSNFSPVCDLDPTYYAADCTWSGEIREDAGPDAVDAVCLWPVN